MDEVLAELKQKHEAKQAEAKRRTTTQKQQRQASQQKVKDMLRGKDKA